MMNMLKFKLGGAAEFKVYVAKITNQLKAVGGKPIFRLFDHVRTVINGGGLIPDWDGIFIVSFPSPAKFLEFSSSDEYKDAHRHRAAALEATEMYAMRAAWTTKTTREARSGSGLAAAARRAPNWELDLEEPRRLARSKTKEQMRAISGSAEAFMKYLADDRFASGRVWQLNLLKMEPGEQGRFYAEYAARAQAHIGRMEASAAGAVGGMRMASLENQVWSLRGPQWNHIAIMQYPSRQAFVGYAQGADRKGDQGMSDGFLLRTAGLAVQGLISLAPESDSEAMQDDEGPRLTPAPSAKL